jgi:hypothetical protein
MGFQRRRSRSRIDSYVSPFARASRTAGANTLRVELVTHAIDDLVIEALVGLRFARQHAPLALPGGLSFTGLLFGLATELAATTLATQRP